MPSTFAEAAGLAEFDPQATRQPAAPRRHLAVLELIAGLALVISIVVAVMAIGLAHGNTLADWQAQRGLHVVLWAVATLATLSGLSGLVTCIVPSARRAIRVH